MYRWAKGIFGAGLSRSTKGMLPTPVASASECPCDFEVYHGWEGPQIVARFHYPYGDNVSAIKIVRQVQHYPYDIEDGQLVFEANGPFGTTTGTSQILLTGVDASAGPVFSTLPGEASGTSSELDAVAEGEVFKTSTVVLTITVGSTVLYIVDDGAGNFEIADQGQWLTATAYTVGESVYNNGVLYTCTSNHTSSASTEPGVGASWATVWSVGGIALSNSSVVYCTMDITLDLTSYPPDTGSDITLSAYEYMNEQTVSTLARGTVSGGKCTDNGSDVDYTEWTGYVNGNSLTVAAGSYDASALANGTYYLTVDEDGNVVAGLTTIPTDKELLCEFDVAAGVVTEVRNRHTYIKLDPDFGKPFEFFYYAAFIYDSISLTWERCSGMDYALEYDSEFLPRWLYNHTPRQWRIDDREQHRIVLRNATLDDGQQINIHESGEMRGPLYRWLKWFGLQLERDHAYIRAIALLYVDADQAPPPVLSLMAAALGYRLPQDWDLMKQRLYVKQITAAWRKKGTEEAVLMAAYRAVGIIPTVVEMHNRLLYTNMYGRHTLNTTAPGGIETATDPHYYVYGPDRPDHYHERGLSLFFTDPTNSLTDSYTQTIKRFVSANTQGIFKTVGSGVDTLSSIDGVDFIRPSSVTISWESASVIKQVVDDGYGGFTGDGTPTGCSIDYQTKQIVLDTRGDIPDQGTAITIQFTSTASGPFRRLDREVKDAVAGTAHVAYYVNDYLMRVSD